ncbi:unnamed protein product [Ceratitis capitata]|uniref:(Mediterranean fruit fly) hypothetical protein n=1 Tax=Ceratitis capitata TaxID=7213 RepID=A0A811V5V3_CERCA|nr:unnamed protein product [Ceratitis capitata]
MRNKEEEIIKIKGKHEKVSCICVLVAILAVTVMLSSKCLIVAFFLNYYNNGGNNRTNKKAIINEANIKATKYFLLFLFSFQHTYNYNSPTAYKKKNGNYLKW